MRLSLKSPTSTARKGSLNISITGEELKKMSGHYKPGAESRATIRLEGDGTVLSVKIDKAGTYRLSMPAYVKDKTGDLDNVITAVLKTNLIEDYGFKAVQKTQTEDILPEFKGQHMYIAVPPKFFRASPAAKGQSNGKPLFEKIKEMIAGLNTLLADASRAGFHIDLSVHEGLIKGKASRTQEIEF